MKVGVNMSNEELVNKKFEKNNYITTNDLINMGITKTSITKLLEEGVLKKVGHGIYMKPDILEDEYYLIQLRYPKTVFSYNTAFHILNMTNFTPPIIDITSIRGRAVVGNYNVHYVTEDKYDLGIITIESPFGNPIKVYNAERSICDMLKSDYEFDLELQNRILNNYFRSENKNIKLLEEYAKKLKVYDKVSTIIMLMMKW